MNIRPWILLLFLLYAFNADAQPLIFKQEYDVTGDVFTKGYHTNTLDGGMILITRSTNINGTQYFTLFKTFANGDLQWSQRFVQPGNCSLSNVVQSPDSTYFFCFVELNYPEKYYITKLDANGNLLYCKSLTPPPGYIVAFDPQCIAKSDGHVYVASDLNDLVTGMFAWHLFEVDATGNLVFSTCYNGGFLKCLGRSINLCSNGDILFAGYQRDSIAMHYGPMLTRIDSDGVVLWSKLYLDTTADIAGLVAFEMSSGQIVMIASHTTPGNELIRLQTDAQGNLIRAREYGRPLHSISPTTALSVENNSLLTFGTTDTGSFCVKLDSVGEVLYAKRFSWIVPNRIRTTVGPGYSFGGVNTQSNHAVIFTSDTTLASCFGTAIAMDTGSVSFQTIPQVMSYSVQLFDTAFALQDTLWAGSNIKVCGPVGMDETYNEGMLEVYPNPASDVIVITGITSAAEIILINTMGQTLPTDQHSGSTIVMDISTLPDGVYLVMITDRKKCVMKKLIISH